MKLTQNISNSSNGNVIYTIPISPVVEIYPVICFFLSGDFGWRYPRASSIYWFERIQRIIFRCIEDENYSFSGYCQWQTAVCASAHNVRGTRDILRIWWGRCQSWITITVFIK